MWKLIKIQWPVILMLLCVFSFVGYKCYRQLEREARVREYFWTEEGYQLREYFDTGDIEGLSDRQLQRVTLPTPEDK